MYTTPADGRIWQNSPLHFAVYPVLFLLLLLLLLKLYLNTVLFHNYIHKKNNVIFQ